MGCEGIRGDQATAQFHRGDFGEGFGGELVLPQLEVLSHESIGYFLTHCGFNSVLEAPSLGVTMVVMPTDQGSNAVEDVWEIGMRARPDDEIGFVTEDSRA